MFEGSNVQLICDQSTYACLHSLSKRNLNDTNRIKIWIVARKQILRRLSAIEKKFVDTWANLWQRQLVVHFCIPPSSEIFLTGSLSIMSREMMNYVRTKIQWPRVFQLILKTNRRHIWCIVYHVGSRNSERTNEKLDVAFRSTILSRNRGSLLCKGSADHV